MYRGPAHFDECPSVRPSGLPRAVFFFGVRGFAIPGLLVRHTHTHTAQHSQDCCYAMNITPSQIIIGCKNSGLATQASIFKPNIAKTIYNIDHIIILRSIVIIVRITRKNL